MMFSFSRNPPKPNTNTKVPRTTTFVTPVYTPIKMNTSPLYMQNMFENVKTPHGCRSCGQ